MNGCTHAASACCWLCSWDGQSWWPEARQKALDTGHIKMSDLTLELQVRHARRIIETYELARTG